MSVTINGRLDTEPTFVENVRGDIEVWLRIWDHNWAAGQPIPIRNVLRLIWNYPGLRAALLYRLSYFLWRKHVPALPGVFTRLNLTLHGFDVPRNVAIGPGLYVPHPVGTVITAKRIGRNLSVISCNTIGMRNEHEFPTLGDNVFMGAGARVLGGITIGNNVQIGANAVVMIDVPDNSTAVGVPARVLPPK